MTSRLIFFFQFLAITCLAQQSQDTLTATMSEEISGVEIYSTLIDEENVVSLSRKQFLSLAGSLEDPTRLLIKFPGTSTVNDQANSVIFRAMPSQFHRWSLYGARILNPNHLGNAGTISDFPARSSGGVNMFSGQVIGNLEFNGNPSGKSLDALSSSSDMRLRNPFKNAITTNLSLIGIEAGLDRLLEGGNSSLILNYRYSTVGLLTSMGLDFGGEMINYQDFTGKYSKTMAGGGQFGTYLTLGYNTNVKDAIGTDEEPEEFKDLQEIDYNSLNIIGGAYLNFEKEDYDFLNTINISVNNTERSSFIPDNSVGNISNTKYDSDELLISSSHQYTQKSDGLEYGFSFQPYLYSISLQKQFPDASLTALNEQTLDHTALHLIPALFSKYAISDRFSLSGKIGVQGVLASKNVWNWLGQGALNYANADFVSSLRYSRATQLFQPEILIYGIDPQFSQSDNIELNLSYKGFGISGFVHKLSNMPLSASDYGFSSLENLDNLPLIYDNQEVDISVDGGADIYGISLSFNKSIAGVHVMSNLTLTDSEHKGIEESSRVPLDYGHVFNLSLTKNWKIGSRGKEWGISAAFHHRGGAIQNQVDLSRSFQWGYTNYSFDNPFSLQLEDYYRMDLRIIYKPSARATLSLDIQNVMSRENDAYYFYDVLTGESQLKRQLGMIPILAWRVNW